MFSLCVFAIFQTDRRSFLFCDSTRIFIAELIFVCQRMFGLFLSKSYCYLMLVVDSFDNYYKLF